MYCIEMDIHGIKPGIKVIESKRKLDFWFVDFHHFAVQLRRHTHVADHSCYEARYYELRNAYDADPTISQILLNHGDSHNINKSPRVYEARRNCVWNANTSKNKHGRTMLVPDEGNLDTLLVRASTWRYGMLRPEAQFMLPHTFTVHEAIIRNKDEGTCTDALFRLAPNQAVRLHLEDGRCSVLYHWSGKKLWRVTNFTEGGNTDDEVDIPALIEAEKTANQAAYTAIDQLWEQCNPRKAQA